MVVKTVRKLAVVAVAVTVVAEQNLVVEVETSELVVVMQLVVVTVLVTVLVSKVSTTDTNK